MGSMGETMQRHGKKTIQIVNIGVYPPPFGGVSSHLIRLKAFLEKHTDNVLFLDCSKLRVEEKLAKGIISGLWNVKTYFQILFGKRSILHFHDLSPKYLLFNYFILSLRHTIVVSFHNELFIDKLRSKGKMKFYILVCLLNQMHKFIVDNNKCFILIESVISNPGKIEIIPEFIPPSMVPPLERDDVLALRKKHKYLLSSNAYQISFHKNEDLYGIDLLIDVLNSLYHSFGFDVAIAFLLPAVGNPDYFLNLKQRLKQYTLEDRFLFITNPIEEASSLWKISDGVIRATNTDGNSVSILEALHLGVPVVASDCVERPAGVVLFKSRDAEDLKNKIVFLFDNLDLCKRNAQSAAIGDNALKMLSLYQTMRESNRRVFPMLRTSHTAHK
jgi:glycosyltransferase involved in cell wall biosynthesis